MKLKDFNHIIKCYQIADGSSILVLHQIHNHPSATEMVRGAHPIGFFVRAVERINGS